MGNVLAFLVAMVAAVIFIRAFTSSAFWLTLLGLGVAVVLAIVIPLQLARWGDAHIAQPPPLEAPGATGH